jgi:hypothetical protein
MTTADGEAALLRKFTANDMTPTCSEGAAATAFRATSEKRCGRDLW